MKFYWCEGNLCHDCYDFKHDNCEKCNIVKAYSHGYEQAQKDDSSIGKWILVSERLPEYRQAVLISTYWGVRVAERDSVKEDGADDFWYMFLDDATAHPRYVYAWMPLPEPYKGGDTE